MNQPFNYKQLHYFWVVVKEGGIARAAHRLGMAVQTVSVQVRGLELELGFALFKSLGRRLVRRGPHSPAKSQPQVFNHLLGAASVQWYATPHCALPRFPKCLGEMPLLLPTRDMALRGRIDGWLEDQSIRPRITGEFADSGLIATLGATGMGAFPATAWSRADLTRRQGLKLLGSSPEASEQFFAISAARKIQDPLIQTILAQRIK